MSFFIANAAHLLHEGNSVGFSDISDILSSVTTQFSVANIVAVIAGILGVTTAFVFLWWGVRKAYRAIIAGTTRGKARV